MHQSLAAKVAAHLIKCANVYSGSSLLLWVPSSSAKHSEPIERVSCTVHGRWTLQ